MVSLTKQPYVWCFLLYVNFMRSNFNLYVNDGSRHKGKHDYKSLRCFWLVLVLTLFRFWCWPQIAKSWCCYQCMMQTSLLVISHDSECICKINNLMASHKECLPFKYSQSLILKCKAFSLCFLLNVVEWAYPDLIWSFDTILCKESSLHFRFHI